VKFLGEAQHEWLVGV